MIARDKNGVSSLAEMISTDGVRTVLQYVEVLRSTCCQTLLLFALQALELLSEITIIFLKFQATALTLRMQSFKVGRPQKKITIAARNLSLKVVRR